jgi:hypothetical protein
MDASSRKSRKMARSWIGLCPAVDCNGLIIMMLMCQVEVTGQKSVCVCAGRAGFTDRWYPTQDTKVSTFAQCLNTYIDVINKLVVIDCEVRQYGLESLCRQIYL